VIISSGYTDKGLIREINEDNWYVNEPSPTSKTFYAIVADGMGGHNAGEVASNIATTTISEYINNRYSDKLSYDELKGMLLKAVEEANTKIFAESLHSKERTGMGTTLVMCFVINNKVIVTHVGDSRVYIVRKNTIYKITKDHSLVAQLVEEGKITEKEALNHPQKNVITRALGTDTMVDIDMCEFDLYDGDYILLCTDGLSNMLTDEEILTTITESENVIISPKNLVDRANENGGNDNITAVVLKYADILNQDEKGMNEDE